MATGELSRQHKLSSRVRNPALLERRGCFFESECGCRTKTKGKRTKGKRTKGKRTKGKRRSYWKREEKVLLEKGRESHGKGKIRQSCESCESTRTERTKSTRKTNIAGNRTVLSSFG